MGKHFDEALKLLADNKIDEANGILESIEDEIEELEDDRDLIKEMIDRKRGPVPLKSKGKPQLKLPLPGERKPKLRVVANEDRSDFIKRFAQEMVGKVNGHGRVAITDVAEAIKAAGYDLGTTIPGTVIANVLYKDSNWTRVDKGIFKFNAPQVTQ